MTWISTADEIATDMTRMSLPALDPAGLKALAFQLEALAVAKRLDDSIGPAPPAEVLKKAKALQRAAVDLRELLREDTFGAASQIVKQAAMLLEQDAASTATDHTDIRSRALNMIGFQAPLGRTEVFGNVGFVPLAPLGQLQAQLGALAAAARAEIRTMTKAGRGVRRKEFRQITIGQHLPQLYADLYPAERRGTYDPIEGTLDGPLYRFVAMAAQALGLGFPQPETIQQAIRRQRKVSPA